jgi:hypothetical protein
MGIQMRELFKLDWLIELLKRYMSRFLVIFCTCCQFPFPQILASSRLSYDPNSRHVAPFLLILWKSLFDNLCMLSGVLLLDVCLFRLCNFCNIHTECYEHTEPSVTESHSGLVFLSELVRVF